MARTFFRISSEPKEAASQSQIKIESPPEPSARMHEELKTTVVIVEK